MCSISRSDSRRARQFSALVLKYSSCDGQSFMIDASQLTTVGLNQLNEHSKSGKANGGISARVIMRRWSDVNSIPSFDFDDRIIDHNTFQVRGEQGLCPQIRPDKVDGRHCGVKQMLKKSDRNGESIRYFRIPKDRSYRPNDTKFMGKHSSLTQKGSSQGSHCIGPANLSNIFVFRYPVFVTMKSPYPFSRRLFCLLLADQILSDLKKLVLRTPSITPLTCIKIPSMFRSTLTWWSVISWH
jgi:hypothetical protein